MKINYSSHMSVASLSSVINNCYLWTIVGSWDIDTRLSKAQYMQLNTEAELLLGIGTCLCVNPLGTVLQLHEQQILSKRSTHIMKIRQKIRIVRFKLFPFLCFLLITNGLLCKFKFCFMYCLEYNFDQLKFLLMYLILLL